MLLKMPPQMLPQMLPGCGASPVKSPHLSA